MFSLTFLYLGIRMKRVRAEGAVGKSLAHDTIHYGPGLKDVLFKRGHVVQSEDVEKLKDTGNYFIYVSEGKEEEVHEDEAALRMARVLVSENLSHTKPEKGRVAILAETPGLLKVKADVVKQINLIDDFILVTRADDTGVRKRQVVGAVKIVPLTVDDDRMREVEEILRRNRPVLRVVSPKIEKIAVVVVGTEVYEGRIKDAFVPILRKKLEEYGLRIRESVVLPDDREKISEEIIELKRRGNELILVTGGMAVDAEDVTPDAVKNTGAEVISRGAPTFPGPMIILAYLDSVPILGVPAAAIPFERTSLDRILPRVLAGEKMTRESIAELGPGGLLPGAKA